MNTKFMAPPILQGDSQRQIASIRDYLVAMSRTLTTAFNNIDASNFADGSEAQKIVSGAGSDSTKAEISSQLESLKSYIINTADIIQSEIDVISADLTSNYVAKNDYNAYQQTVTTQFTATADNITANYNAIASLSGTVAAGDLAFDEYVESTQGYIVSGILEWDGLTPVFGIAVGQGLNTTEVTYNGQTYLEVNPNEFMTQYRADRISFRRNGQEVAWISNDGEEILHINKVEAVQSMTVGTNWMWTHDAGLSLKWVGATS